MLVIVKVPIAGCISAHVIATSRSKDRELTCLPHPSIMHELNYLQFVDHVICQGLASRLPINILREFYFISCSFFVCLYLYVPLKVISCLLFSVHSELSVSCYVYF
jgi:hypothetical protein